MQKEKVVRLTTLGMLTALAFLVMVIGRVPIVPSLGFLKYDPKDVILVMSGLIYGPLACIASTLLVAFLEMITVSSTGFIGFAMNVLASLAFTLPTILFYRRKRTLGNALAGLTVGVILMSIVMLLWNYILTPIFLGWPRDKVIPILLPGILPFNLIKGAINGALILLLYKPLSRALRLKHLAPERSGAMETKAMSKGVLYAMYGGSAFVLVTLVLIVLAWQGVF